MVKKKTFKLATFIQAFLIVNEISGNNAGDMLNIIVDALLGNRSINVGSALASELKQSLMYIESYPERALIAGGSAALMTTLLRKLLGAVGVPKTIDIGFCRVEVR